MAISNLSSTIYRLYGITILQTVVYYQSSHRDGWFVKSVVSIELNLLAACIYHIIVTDLRLMVCSEARTVTKPQPYVAALTGSWIRLTWASFSTSYTITW